MEKLEELFLQLIKDEPQEVAHLYAYHDWLIDNDRGEDAANLKKPIRQFKDLKGHILTKIENIKNEELYFVTLSGTSCRLYHYQDCCEYVYIEDICGDLNDLLNTPLLLVEDNTGEDGKGGQWTFYRFATIKGGVTVRFYGDPSYYSMSVTFQVWGEELVWK
jgi:hypothetical protein